MSDALDQLNELLNSLPKEKVSAFQAKLSKKSNAELEDELFGGLDDEKKNSYNDYCISNGSYVRVEEDEMTAWLYLRRPQQGQPPFSRSAIVQFINENKVIRGLHESNISAIAKKQIYDREVVVARGKEAVNATAGYYEYFFDTRSKKSPMIREDGSVDYAAMNELSNVHKGDRVALYHEATECIDGYTVYGKDIVAKQAKNLLPLKGRGIDNSADPNVYLATMDGRIELKGDKIDIKDVYEFKGDVNLVTGRVEFFGDIHIKGNVESGVVIRASRNITIDGLVEAATIYAGGDIVISRGVQGGQKAKITAKGDICADFIEHATVESGGVIRANSFINSNVSAEGEVIAEGKNGSIIGGTTHGLKKVTATKIGNENGTKTIVSSGYLSQDYIDYIDICQKEIKVQSILSETVEEMTAILRTKRLGSDKDSEATDTKLIELNDRKDKLFNGLDATRQEKERLGLLIEKGKGSSIMVSERIYEGSVIEIEGCSIKIATSSSYMQYKNEGGKIISTVYGV